MIGPAGKRDEKTAALMAYTERVRNDPQVEQVLVPIRDGMLVARRK